MQICKISSVEGHSALFFEAFPSILMGILWVTGLKCGLWCLHLLPDPGNMLVYMPCDWSWNKSYLLQSFLWHIQPKQTQWQEKRWCRLHEESEHFWLKLCCSTGVHPESAAAPWLHDFQNSKNVLCASKWTHSCICARASDKEGCESKRKRQQESSAQISECVWQRGQPCRQVPALQHRKWHMTALTFVIPCLLTAPKPSLQQTLRRAELHALKDTQSHTVYCLDYIIFVPGTWALLVGWHLGLCSSKVTFLCPWVKDACLQHAFEMKDGEKSDEKDFQKHFDQRHQQSRTNLLSSM